MLCLFGGYMVEWSSFIVLWFANWAAEAGYKQYWSSQKGYFSGWFNGFWTNVSWQSDMENCCIGCKWEMPAHYACDIW